MADKAEWTIEAEKLFPTKTNVELAHHFHHLFPNLSYRQMRSKIKNKREIWRNQKVQNNAQSQINTIAQLTNPNTDVQYKAPSFASTATFNEIKQAVMPETYNPYNLPTPDDDNVLRFKLPVGCNNILFLSDIHIPYHDIPSLTAAIKYGKDNDVNTIYLNGDIGDFHGQSKYEKDPKLRSPAEEVKMIREFLGLLREIFPNAQIFFKEGNHDRRWLAYIRSKAPIFEEFEEFSLESILHLNKHGVHHIDDTTIVEIGKLVAIHGHEVYGSGGVMPARSLWLKVKCSAIMSHVHVPTEFSEKSIKDEFYTCWSTGCLSGLRPKYNPNARYVHGFAHIKTEDNGNFTVKNFRIVNGKIL